MAHPSLLRLTAIHYFCMCVCVCMNPVLLVSTAIVALEDLMISKDINAM